MAEEAFQIHLVFTTNHGYRLQHFTLLAQFSIELNCFSSSNFNIIELHGLVANELKLYTVGSGLNITNLKVSIKVSQPLVECSNNSNGSIREWFPICLINDSTGKRAFTLSKRQRTDQ